MKRSFLHYDHVFLPVPFHPLKQSLDIEKGLCCSQGYSTFAFEVSSRTRVKRTSRKGHAEVPEPRARDEQNEPYYNVCFSHLFGPNDFFPKQVYLHGFLLCLKGCLPGPGDFGFVSGFAVLGRCLLCLLILWMHLAGCCYTCLLVSLLVSLLRYSRPDDFTCVPACLPCCYTCLPLVSAYSGYTVCLKNALTAWGLCLSQSKLPCVK